MNDSATAVEKGGIEETVIADAVRAIVIMDFIVVGRSGSVQRLTDRGLEHVPMRASF